MSTPSPARAPRHTSPVQPHQTQHEQVIGEHLVRELAEGEAGAGAGTSVWAVEHAATGNRRATCVDRDAALGRARDLQDDVGREAAGARRRAGAGEAPSQAPAAPTAHKPSRDRWGTRAWSALGAREAAMLSTGRDPRGSRSLDGTGARTFAQTMVVSMRSRGWDRGQIEAVFCLPGNLGAASVTRRWAATASHPGMARSDWLRQLHRAIDSADAWLDAREADPKVHDSIAGRAGALAAWSIWLDAHPYAGRSGTIDTLVMRHVMGRVQSMGMVNVSVPLRPMLEATGIGSTNTARASLARLVAAGHLKLVDTSGSHRGLGHLYSLRHPPEQASVLGLDQSAATSTGTDTLEALSMPKPEDLAHLPLIRTGRTTVTMAEQGGHDAWALRGLRRTGLSVVATLEAGPGTVAQIAQRSGHGASTVREALIRLEKEGLASWSGSERRRTWRAIQGDTARLEQIAVKKGTAGRARKVVARHQREREAWLAHESANGAQVAERLLARALRPSEVVDWAEWQVYDTSSGETIDIRVLAGQRRWARLRRQLLAAQDPL